MALLWFEGFEVDLNTTDLARKYASFSNTGLLGDVGRWGGVSLRGDTFNTVLKTPNLGNKNNAIMGCNIKIPGPTANITERLLFTLFDGANEQIALYWLTDGSGNIQFRVKRGSTTLATTSNSWNPRFWNLVEFKVLLDTNGSNGEVEVRVNGLSELLVQNTDTTNHASLVWNQLQTTVTAPASTSFVIDDVYLLDSSGAKNNTWLGEHAIEGFTPNGNGNRNQWDTGPAAGGSNHFTFVDEGTINDDTDFLFIHNTDDGKVELFAWSDATFLTDPIYGLFLEYDLRMDTGDQDKARPIFRNGGGTEATGTEVTAAQVSSYQRFYEIFENDPTLGTALTVTNWNAMQVGLESRP